MFFCSFVSFLARCEPYGHTICRLCPPFDLFHSLLWGQFLVIVFSPYLYVSLRWTVDYKNGGGLLDGFPVDLARLSTLTLTLALGMLLSWLLPAFVGFLATAPSVSALGSQCSGPLGAGTAGPNDPFWLETIKHQASISISC